jgi:hypothetical protein
MRSTLGYGVVARPGLSAYRARPAVLSVPPPAPRPSGRPATRACTDRAQSSAALGTRLTSVSIDLDTSGRRAIRSDGAASSETATAFMCRLSLPRFAAPHRLDHKLVPRVVVSSKKVTRLHCLRSDSTERFQRRPIKSQPQGPLSGCLSASCRTAKACVCIHRSRRRSGGRG